MPGSILGVRFTMISYPRLPGTIGPFLCRLSQQTIQLSIHAGFFIFKESIININIKIITNELDGPVHNTVNCCHELIQLILIFFLFQPF